MTNSPDKTNLWVREAARLTGLLTVSILVGAIAAVESATAQEQDPAPEASAGLASGPPLPLQPGPYVSPETMSRLAPGQVPEAGRATSRPRGAGIESGILATVDPAAIGILGPETGGLPADLWSGASRSVLESLLPQLPVATLSPTANALGRRLLLTAGPVPEALREQDQGALLEIRLEAIAAMGRLEPLITYLSLLPEQQINIRIRRIMADAYLLDGNLPAACDSAELGRTEAGTAYWLRLEALCMAIGGNASGAAHNIDLLVETGEVSPPFVRLTDAVLRRRRGLAGDPAEAPLEAFKGPEVDAVMVALARAAEQPIDIDAPENLPLLVKAALAKNGNLSLDLRADLGEMAAMVGALDSEVLGEIFLGFEFAEGEYNSVQILAQTDLGARVDALIYAMAVEATSNQERLELVELGWARGTRMEILPALGPIYANLVERIRPRQALMEWAPLIGRVLLYAGRSEAADGWSEMLLEQVVLGGSASGSALAGLWPLQLASGSDLAAPFSLGSLSQWRQTISRLPRGEQLRRATLFYSLLEALGQPVPQVAWEEVLAAPSPGPENSPGFALWRQLIVSANAGRLGETISLVLVGLGRDGSNATSLAALTTAIAALRRVGLEAEARALARERLVAAGF